MTEKRQKPYLFETRIERRESLAAIVAHTGMLYGYAKNGWPVVPLHTPSGDGGCSCSRGKECPSPGKHPRTPNGFKDASTDSFQIGEWWEKWPDANIGIVTGAVSGLFVLDVDLRHGGDETLAQMERQYGALPRTAKVRTGGGWHYYFRHPGGEVRSGKLGPGIDLKADGGYVVAPPSLHASGQSYEWEVRP